MDFVFSLYLFKNVFSHRCGDCRPMQVYGWYVGGSGVGKVSEGKGPSLPPVTVER